MAGGLTLPRYLYSWQTDPQHEPVQTVPRFTEVSSLEELETAVGFELEELSGLPFAVTDVTYTVFGQEMAEIRYLGEEETAVFRKAAGGEDPSGDYTQYGDILTISAAGHQVTLKGDQGLYFLAIWQEGACTCSLRLSCPLDAGNQMVSGPLFLWVVQDIFGAAYTVSSAMRRYLAYRAFTSAISFS